jgi:hypothetical protein
VLPQKLRVTLRQRDSAVVQVALRECVWIFIT